MTEPLNAAAERLKPFISLRDAYASQAKFADHEAASYFREFVRRLDAALLAARSTPTAPAGEWVTVPRESTEAMKQAGFRAWLATDFPDDVSLGKAWAAMVDAAPKSGSAQ